MSLLFIRITSRLTRKSVILYAGALWSYNFKCLLYERLRWTEVAGRPMSDESFLHMIFSSICDFWILWLYRWGSVPHRKIVHFRSSFRYPRRSFWSMILLAQLRGRYQFRYEFSSDMVRYYNYVCCNQLRSCDPWAIQLSSFSSFNFVYDPDHAVSSGLVF